MEARIKLIKHLHLRVRKIRMMITLEPQFSNTMITAQELHRSLHSISGITLELTTIRPKRRIKLPILRVDFIKTALISVKIIDLTVCMSFLSTAPTRLKHP
jgi:hypothetical protein